MKSVNNTVLSRCVTCSEFAMWFIFAIDLWPVLWTV